MDKKGSSKIKLFNLYEELAEDKNIPQHPSPLPLSLIVLKHRVQFLFLLLGSPREIETQLNSSLSPPPRPTAGYSVMISEKYLTQPFQDPGEKNN